MRKICIAGAASSSAHEIPWHDESWEIWAMPWRVSPRADLYFEPHESALDLNYYPGGVNPADWLRECGKPVMMEREFPEIPNARPIPWADIRALVGKAVNGRDPSAPYAESTVGIMLACAALWLKPGDKVGIWGVDLDTAEEWAYQRPNVEYLIGFLRGRGISVYLPPQTAITSTLCPDYGRYGGYEMDSVRFGINWGPNVNGERFLYRSKDKAA